MLKVNTELEDSPEYVNESPYDQGWMRDVQMDNIDDIQHLIRAKEYKDYVYEKNGGNHDGKFTINGSF
ncbi:hypothetical protein H2N74_16060 [Bacillus velezensis]|uniref:hypothetical protein n=1 Tax=Bacillus TaxID=1386 RepID=UPI0009ADECEC|nr:hypothetical protein CFN60_15920 [Bacillus velezensis]ATV24141.1 hypothetical protein CS547_15975 [Bacillus sp. Lzh-5]MBS0048290.1 hypothetical protein [Bacillus velezensis]MCA1232178.1 hypothetical protein [Bacillus velezensis]MCA1310132.1 hypothetical protein [Bacillus velezensis]